MYPDSPFLTTALDFYHTFILWSREAAEVLFLCSQYKAGDLSFITQKGSKLSDLNLLGTYNEAY